MSKSQVLVTGSGGFIGSHLVEELIERGHRVKAFVRYNSTNNWGWLETLPNSIKKEIDVFAGDIRDPNGVREAMKGSTQVFHLAALIGIPYSYHSPHSYVETNISGTLNVLQAARDLGVERVVQTSTSEVYGTARFVPITEEHPLQGQSPYSATKIGSDQLALSFYQSFQLPVCVIRPFNTYGPRQSARAIIPTIISQIASGQREIKLGSLHPTRDFNYVKDTARGFIDVGTHPAASGEVINLASNFEISIGDLLKHIASVMRVDITTKTEESRLRPEKSEVERLWGDNSKAFKLTSWRPQFGGTEGFKRGLSETIEWFSQSSNLSRYKTDVYNV